MRKRYKVWLIVIFFLIIAASSIAVLSLFREEETKIKNVTSIISSINEFNYTLDDRDTEYMKEEFENLKQIISEAEIDYEEYAKSLAKLFVIDFYTLNNKINKYDVGSLEYILEDKVSSFKLKAMDTIYNDIIDNTYKDRVQELPEITKVKIQDFAEETITLNDEEVDAYKVTMTYEYRKNLGYDKEGTVYLVKNRNKLEIVSYEPKINNKN